MKSTAERDENLSAQIANAFVKEERLNAQRVQNHTGSSRTADAGARRGSM